TTACSGGIQPPERSHGIRQRARPADRVLKSEWLLHARKIGARSGAEGLGATLRRRRFPPRACGSPLYRAGGLPRGPEGNAGSLAADPAHRPEGEFPANRNATRGIPFQSFQVESAGERSRTQSTVESVVREQRHQPV